MATVKYSNTMDKPAIELAIKSIGTRGANLDRDIQLTALSVLAHIAKHKEVSLFTKLYNVMPKGSRTNALVAWALAFGAVVVNVDKETKKERPFLYADKETNLTGATDKPWFLFKKPADPADEFNPELAFLKFMEKVQAGIKAGKINAADGFVAQLVTAASTATDRAKAATTVTPPVAAEVEPTPGQAVDAE